MVSGFFVNEYITQYPLYRTQDFYDYWLISFITLFEKTHIHFFAVFFKAKCTLNKKEFGDDNIK